MKTSLRLPSEVARLNKWVVMEFFTDNWIMLILGFVLAVTLYAGAINVFVNAIDEDNIDDSRRVRSIKDWITEHQLVKLMVLAIAPLLVGMFGLYLMGMVLRILIMEEIPGIASDTKDFLAKNK